MGVEWAAAAAHTHSQAPDQLTQQHPTRRTGTTAPRRWLSASRHQQYVRQRSVCLLRWGRVAVECTALSLELDDGVHRGSCATSSLRCVVTLLDRRLAL